MINIKRNLEEINLLRKKEVKEIRNMGLNTVTSGKRLRLYISNSIIYILTALPAYLSIISP